MPAYFLLCILAAFFFSAYYTPRVCSRGVFDIPEKNSSSYVVRTKFFAYSSWYNKIYPSHNFNKTIVSSSVKAKGKNVKSTTAVLKLKPSTTAKFKPTKATKKPPKKATKSKPPKKATTKPPKKPPTKKPTLPPKKVVESESVRYAKLVLQRHNHYRKIHGVPPLALNARLSAISEKYAKELSRLNRGKGWYEVKLEHSPAAINGNYGENLYWISIPNGISANVPVDAWYDEIRYYDFREISPKNIKKIGHFTALVWKNSKELGVGVSKGPEGTFVVCNYTPAGNVLTQFVKNVPRPKQ